MSEDGAKKVVGYHKPTDYENLTLEGLEEKRNRNGNLYFENDSGEIVARQCSKCRKVKTAMEYSKQKKGLGGLTSECKECTSIWHKNYRKENPEKLLEKSRKSYEENREYYARWRKENSEYRKQYYLNNREQELEYARMRRKENLEYYTQYSSNWYQANKLYFLEYRRNWRINNPEKTVIFNQRRRARKASLPDTLTVEEYAETLAYFGNACALTGQTENIEKEHAIPISIGHGGTTFENIYPITKSLNCSKFNSNIFEWFEANRQRFELSQERFDKLIAYLASANAMTVEEYRDHVYWCHANPRNIDEINDANDGGNRQAI